eukprot:scaffold6753_cov49-Phaeocystis_antarctica.AAC.3
MFRARDGKCYYYYLPSVLGCVFATCCCCKIVGGAGAHGEGARLFGDLHFGDAEGEEGAACAECADDTEGADGTGPNPNPNTSPNPNPDPNPNP